MSAVMCGTGAFNLCINQGATVSLVFIWTTGPCCGCGTVGATPQAVDITGYTAAMQFRNYYGGTLLYDASGDLVLGGIYGTITLSIPASATASFGWYQGVYDLLLTSSQGVATRLLAGNVCVSPQVTT
jgi:hypothetical protein